MTQHLISGTASAGHLQVSIREFIGKRIPTSKLVARIVHRLPEGETFGAQRVAEEANRRHADKLKKPVDARQVSVVLRRMRDTGDLHQTQPGGAAHEALYTKQRPKEVPGTS
jgi:hypothetical protein